MSRILLLPLLGLCEHCNALLNLEGMTADTMDADIICPKCNKMTTHLSFGYEKVGDDWKKIRWPGKVGNGFGWISVKPDRDFAVGSVEVWVEMPPFNY